jgi:phospholipid/cholesterol/gamma-HCH transport system substrate-binding protein
MSLPHTKNEVLVGMFVMLGIAALAYLSISIGGLELFPPERYAIKARFASVGDLKQGAPVRLAGVKVGEVTAVRLADYLAEADLAVGRSISLPKDTIASIRTEGLLGDTYVSLTPGGSLDNLRPGDLVAQTEPAIDVSDLLARYAFGSRGEPVDREPSDAGARDSDVFKDPLE